MSICSKLVVFDRTVPQCSAGTENLSFVLRMFLCQEAKELAGSDSNDAKHEVCHYLSMTSHPDRSSAIIVFHLKYARV